VRDFLSKAIAGGLSAGVVLLWWPLLFEDVDTVTSWFVRGVAWTVCFELVLVALIPFERALWDSAGGERIVRRVSEAESRLHSGSRRRRIGRLSGIATVALVVPVVLLVTGLHEQAPAHAEAKPVAPIKVVRVTKVVRPVTVKRIVERAPVSGQAIRAAGEPAPSATAPRAVAPTALSPQTAEPVAPREGRTVVPRSAPVQRETAPKGGTQTSPQTVDGCEGEACGSAAPPAVREAEGSAS
jgi:hypothetical protein